MNVHDDFDLSEATRHGRSCDHAVPEHAPRRRTRGWRTLAAAAMLVALSCGPGNYRERDDVYAEFGLAMDDLNPIGVWQLMPDESLHVTRLFAGRDAQPQRDGVYLPAKTPPGVPAPVQGLTRDAVGTLELTASGNAKLVLNSRKSSGAPITREEIEGAWSKGPRTIIVRVLTPAEMAGSEIIFERRSRLSLMSRRGEVWHVWRRWTEY
jgi:hypothetical protein